MARRLASHAPPQTPHKAGVFSPPSSVNAATESTNAFYYALVGALAKAALRPEPG
jgi:hypothetical protein